MSEWCPWVEVVYDRSPLNLRAFLFFLNIRVKYKLRLLQVRPMSKKSKSWSNVMCCSVVRGKAVKNLVKFKGQIITDLSTIIQVTSKGSGWKTSWKGMVKAWWAQVTKVSRHFKLKMTNGMKKFKTTRCDHQRPTDEIILLQIKW